MEDDDDNPWRWIGTAKVGQPCEVIVDDRFGPMRLTHAVALLEDGYWYNIEPPRQLPIRPVAWRYVLQSFLDTVTCLSPRQLAEMQGIKLPPEPVLAIRN